MALRNDRYIPWHRASESTPPHNLPRHSRPPSSPPPLVKMNNKPTTYTIQRGCILLLAERPCLPFSPGVLCSHCLTEWLIWLNFPSQTSQVHSLFCEHPPLESLREARCGLLHVLLRVLPLMLFTKNTGHIKAFDNKTLSFLWAYIQVHTYRFKAVGKARSAGLQWRINPNCVTAGLRSEHWKGLKFNAFKMFFVFWVLFSGN